MHLADHAAGRFRSAADAARIARESNEYAKKLMGDHPGRFGMFAMLPLPHIDESLKEIELRLRHAEGRRHRHDDQLRRQVARLPVASIRSGEELNRRKATVYTHPTGANCCVNLVQGVSDAAMEWGADTTRTIVNLIFSGTAQR